MVNTDFILSYLTGAVNDEILDKLVPDKEIDFSISGPDAYWSKQQIKDSYKTPTGSFNKDAFLSDYDTLSKKYESFQFKRFGETLLNDSLEQIVFKEGGAIPMYQNGQKLTPAISKKDSWTREEYDNSMYGYKSDTSSGDVRDTSTRKIFTGRPVNTQSGVQFVPDQYTTFTHEGGFTDLAKGKSINELAEENDGVIDADGNLVTENIWNKIFDSKYITVDKSGKFQERQYKSGENASLALARGVTKEGEIVLDKVTIGESLFGARQQDDYEWKNRKWYEKIPLGGKLAGEGLLKGGWNLVMGIPYGISSMTRTLASDNEGAPEWLNNVNTFLESQQLRSDIATDEAKWYSAQGMTSGVMSGFGQLGAIAAYTTAAIKLNKKLKINEVLFAKGLNMSTAVGFGLWGAAEVDTQLQAQGNTSADQRKAIHAATVLALTGIGSVTNIFLSKLDPNVRKKIIVDATRTGMQDAITSATEYAGKDLASKASKAIYENLNKTVSKMMSVGYKALKTDAAVGFVKEGTQEISEEIVPDITMLVFPRVYNTLVDAMGGKKEDKFTFNEKGNDEYMDFLTGKHLENYFTAGLFGGITGGVASTAYNWGEEHDPKVSYIGALTMNGEDWSDKNVDTMYEGILGQINKEYNQGKAGPTTMGLDKVSMKNTIITEENKKDVTSYADLIRTQAINDLNIARESVKNLTAKGGTLDEFKTKWNAVNKSVENIEQFNKFALSFAEKASVNTYLMNEFKSLVGAKPETYFQKQQDKLTQIKQRNDLMSENKTDEAQLIQDKLMGITKSTKKNSISVITDLEKSNEAIELVRKQTEETIQDIQQRLVNLTNGVTFIKGMQQAFVRGQVSEGFDIVNNKFKYSNVLTDNFSKYRKGKARRNFKGEEVRGKDVIGSTIQEQMDNFNTLNMTSRSYIEFKNQQIENEIQKIKDLNAPIKEKLDAFNTEHVGLDETKKLLDDFEKDSKRLNKLLELALPSDEERSEIDDLTDSTANILEELGGPGGVKVKLNETTNLLSERRAIESTLIEEPKKIEFSDTPYLNRLDTDKFVSLDSSLEDYVNEAFQKSRILGENNPDFIDNNLVNILKELQIRLAQVELNYGSNRKMADFEKEAIPILSDLLGDTKEGVKSSYDIGKAKVKAIEYGKDKEGKKQKLDRHGSKSFLAIGTPESYLEAKTKLVSLLEQARALKVLSDSNRPDIDIMRMGDDVKHITSQLELFKDILPKSVDTEDLISVAKSLIDEEGRPVPGKLNQDVLNSLISSLNDLEYQVHLGLTRGDTTILDAIQGVKDRFSSDTPLYLGYTKEQYDSLIRNTKNNNIHLFYGWYGLEASSFSKVPSFTQLETIKHTYWNLTSQEEIKSTTKTVFNNSAGLWGNQGSGKTSVCAVMVTKLYKRFLASKEIDNISISKDFTEEEKKLQYSGQGFQTGEGKSAVKHKIYSRINEDKSKGDHYYISDNKFVKVPSGATVFDFSKTMLASSNVDRIWGLNDEFEKAGISRVRINESDTKKGEGDSLYKDPIGTLITMLNEQKNTFANDLIVIDEATLLSGVQIDNLNKALEAANNDRKDIKIKILFLGDLKQSGDPSGFQGKLDKLTVLDKTFTFNTDNRNTSFLVDSTKELSVKFRTGNQTINYNIDYFRNQKYKSGKIEFKSEYYQGNEGLAGFKVSNSEEFELLDLVSKIKNNIITRSDTVVITTSLEKKTEITEKYPDLKTIVYTAEEAQGMDGKKYGIVIPDPNYVYAYTSKPVSLNGVYDIVTAEEARSVAHSKGNKITSSFFDTDSSGKPTGLSVSNLDYQLAYSCISSLGRASEYACLVIPKSGPNHPINAAAEGGNAKSRPFKKDIFSFKPLQPNSVKTNKTKQSELIKSENGKYTGDKSQEKPEEKTSLNVPADNIDDNAGEVATETVPFDMGFVKESDDSIKIVEENGVIFIEEYTSPGLSTKVPYFDLEKRGNSLEDFENSMYFDMKDSNVFIPKSFESGAGNFEKGEKVTARIDVAPLAYDSPKIQIVRTEDGWTKLPGGFSITSEPSNGGFILKFENQGLAEPLVVDPNNPSKLFNNCNQ